MTANQRLALAWLTTDWRTDAGQMTRKLCSLRLAHPTWVDEEYGEFGPRGGYKTRWRLTAAGVLALATETAP